MPRLDIFVTMLWFFLFVAWISLLIFVYTDVIRSGELGGWAKALWVLFVLLLPYLLVLVYLIGRGGDMQERSAAQAQRAQRATESYIRKVALGPSTAEELPQSGHLCAQGVLFSDEFETQQNSLWPQPDALPTRRAAERGEPGAHHRDGRSLAGIHAMFRPMPVPHMFMATSVALVAAMVILS